MLVVNNSTIRACQGTDWNRDEGQTGHLVGKGASRTVCGILIRGYDQGWEGPFNLGESAVTCLRCRRVMR